MTRGTWELGWWAPVPPALEPDELVEPGVHGDLLSAVADGAPLDRLGQHRLESLKAAGLATADSSDPCTAGSTSSPGSSAGGTGAHHPSSQAVRPRDPPVISRAPDSASKTRRSSPRLRQALVAVRLRVALGSTLMPGPIEVATVMPLM